MAMPKYEVNFMVDGRRTQEIVSAFSYGEAQKIIEAQYSGAKITFLGWKRLPG